MRSVTWLATQDLSCFPAEQQALRLAEAIKGGDEEAARQCAVWLSERRVPITVQVKQEADPEQDIR